LRRLHLAQLRRHQHLFLLFLLFFLVLDGLIVGHDVVGHTQVRSNSAKNLGTACDTHNLRVNGVGGDLQELNLLLALGFFLHRDVDAVHDDLFLARQQARIVS
jgi:hypothetical protein